MSKEEEKPRGLMQLFTDGIKKQFDNYFQTFEKSFNSIQNILKDIQIQTKEKEDSFSYTKAHRVTTTATARPTKADISLKNPLDKDSKVYEISFIPDSTFKTKGIIEIHIDDALVFEHKAVADFTDLVDMKLKFRTGKRIKRGKKVEVFVWTSDGSSSKCLFVIQFGE